MGTVSGKPIYGSVHINKNAYITSALVHNQCNIGGNVIICMGTVIVKDVPVGITVIGATVKPYVKK